MFMSFPYKPRLDWQKIKDLRWVAYISIWDLCIFRDAQVMLKLGCYFKLVYVFSETRKLIIKWTFYKNIISMEIRIITKMIY